MLIVEIQVAHHRPEERRQDEAIETHEAEGHAQDRNDLPLVRGIPALWCGHDFPLTSPSGPVVVLLTTGRAAVRCDRDARSSHCTAAVFNARAPNDRSR